MKSGEMIINKLIEDIGGTPSIAFLPYKYAMWDSMETVYDAAVEKGLRTYLMPVPYVTRGDGIWHDESALFGKNIENCSLLFDLKPDIVVIHNPYDGHNKVTSIDPRFYSDKLKAAGFKVVYLAYCGSIFGACFILHNGIKNADYIWVGSEEEKQHYIDLWKTKGVDKSENIFICDVLPKYEAVNKHRTHPECFEHTKKRIVLVCGTLVFFLREPDKRLEKWRNAIMKYAAQDNVSVIFRPHPLMDDTINAMMRHYRLKYDAFLEEIEKYCIIDKSQRFQAAVELSDYLVSDPSSVVEVWKRTGKEYEVIE